MAIYVDEEKILKALEDAFQEEIEKALEPIIEEAKETLEKRLREKIGSLTVGLLKNYSIEKRHEDLLITVRNDTRT